MEAAGCAVRRKGWEVVQGIEKVSCSMRDKTGLGTGRSELELQKEERRRAEALSLLA